MSAARCFAWASSRGVRPLSASRSAAAARKFVRCVRRLRNKASSRRASRAVLGGETSGVGGSATGFGGGVAGFGGGFAGDAGGDS